MNIRQQRLTRLTAVLAAALAFAALSTARASVLVLGGGLAEACSKAARAGRFDDRSLDLCNLALEVEPLRPDARAGTLVNRGVLRLRQRKFDGALLDFDRALQLRPTLGEAHVNRGGALIGKARFADAEREIDRGLALGVEEPEKAHFNRAIAREGQGRMKDAYLDYRRAAELNPAWPEPARQLERFTVTSR